MSTRGETGEAEFFVDRRLETMRNQEKRESEKHIFRSPLTLNRAGIPALESGVITGTWVELTKNHALSRFVA
jgi:hypothetical protein